MKKKIVSLALVASLLALVIVGGTLAYFTDDESATNTFVVGNVNIELTEDTWDDNDNYNSGTKQLEDVQPGVTYTKNPTVTNTGINNAYVRVDVTLNKWTQFAAAANAYGITDLTTIFGGFVDANWVLTEETPAVDAVNNTVTYSYYYIGGADRGILASGEDTGALFTDVTIPKQFNNAQMQTLRPDFAITVTAHAIQADTFTSVEDAFDAYIQQDGDAYLNP